VLGCGEGTRVNEAERALHLFLENGATKRVFKTVNDSGQPSVNVGIKESRIL
jgi:hypothetical protein